MAVRVASDMGLFSVLAPATTPVGVKELAAKKPADEFLVGEFCQSDFLLLRFIPYYVMCYVLCSQCYVERIMRLLVANGFAQEPAPGEYLPTAVSKEMTERTTVGVLESL